MNSDDCPFAHSSLGASCGILKHRTAIGADHACAFESSCRTAKKIIGSDPEGSITLSKSVLLNGVPYAALTAPFYLCMDLKREGGNAVKEQMEKLSAATKEELESKLHDANQLTANALSIISDLIQLNISTTQKAVEDSNVAIRRMLHAHAIDSLMSDASSHAEAASKNAAEYARHLASIAAHAQEDISKSANQNMAELVERVHKFAGQLGEHAPPGIDYVEQFKTNVANMQSAYSSFAQSAQEAIKGYQDQWKNAAESMMGNKPK